MHAQLSGVWPRDLSTPCDERPNDDRRDEERGEGGGKRRTFARKNLPRQEAATPADRESGVIAGLQAMAPSLH